ncbi:chromosome partitioning protein ParB [Luteitalea sp. TBR-22]|uniref:ParB/RepB/Spo0J family partition protein n=1 Tax=Luteitalea sp. TBR-22 TaxID=2802971 RepID=UPI001AF49D73|nr:ParB/RepB/Spo0J family partition protein [Luteitalea sp. TBR-22]BCS36118.1 chromosome partitioning protein ParB [Luteitalea sp. TBR-22]
MAQKSERRPALGRGLSALIPEKPAAPAVAAPVPVTAAADPRQAQREIDLDLIDPNPLQPRTRFDETRLQELAESISTTGLVQPIVVRRKGERFEIVAGERRWRAAQIAGLLKLPVHVTDVSDEKLLQTALIENIQREDLNPIEEALAYRRLGEESGLTQEQIAAAVGKDRATVANHLRLLRLPDQVKARVAGGELSMGHARALLAVEDPAALIKAVDQVIAGGLSVRATEALARKLTEPVEEKPPAPVKDVHTRQAEERLRVVLGTRVTIQRKGKGGRLEIEFVNEDELIRLYELLTET